MMKQARRLQCTAEKTIITLEIHDLMIPRRLLESKDWDDTCEMSICFEKGGKLASTESVMIIKEDLLQAAQENEKGSSELIPIPLPTAPHPMILELPITIYREKKTQKIQEKNSQILLRKCAKVLLSSASNQGQGPSPASAIPIRDQYIGIAKYTLKLHEILPTMNYSLSSMDCKEMRITFDLMTGILLRFTLKVFLPTLENNEKGLSLSEATEGGLFDEHSILAEEHMSTISDLTDISAVGATFPRTMTMRKVSSSFEVQKKEEEETKSEREDFNRRLELYQNDRPSILPSIPIINEVTEEIADVRDADAINNDNTDANTASKPMLTQQNTFFPSQSHSEYYHFYQERLLQKDLQLQQLEEEFHQYKQQSHHERNTLLSQIHSLQTKITNEQYARQLLTDVTMKTDKQLAQSLASLREECIEYQSLYEQTSVEVQLYKEEIRYFQNLTERLVNEKQEERQATQQATEVIAQTMFQKATLQEENEQLIDELIEAKVRIANLLMEREVDQKQVINLKRTLQIYAEQAALLELKLLNAQQRLPVVAVASTMHPVASIIPNTAVSVDYRIETKREDGDDDNDRHVIRSFDNNNNNTLIDNNISMRIEEKQDS